MNSQSLHCLQLTPNVHQKTVCLHVPRKSSNWNQRFYARSLVTWCSCYKPNQTLFKPILFLHNQTASPPILAVANAWHVQHLWRKWQSFHTEKWFWHQSKPAWLPWLVPLHTGSQHVGAQMIIMAHAWWWHVFAGIQMATSWKDNWEWISLTYLLIFHALMHVSKTFI